MRFDAEIVSKMLQIALKICLTELCRVQKYYVKLGITALHTTNKEFVIH
jgi:hypothetical protein